MVQEVVYSTGLMRPKDFWESQPKDIILMIKGFRVQREYREREHLETLRLIRYVGHTVLMMTPMRKGAIKPKLYNYYPLPYDKKKEDITPLERAEFFNQRQRYISNGKMRGWMDKQSRLFNEEDKQIGNIVDNELVYLN